MAIEVVRRFAIEHNSQSHLCICNYYLFEEAVANGIYGFPHSGIRRLKSFWRAVASMYNIGSNDLIFLYRTKGDDTGSQEIYGPFKIYSPKGEPAIYYDIDSQDFPILIGGEIDCRVRFLFESFGRQAYSINDNFELVKRYESKELWGYRHPAVMNIGAARKKSITSFTNKQTLALIDLMAECNQPRLELDTAIPVEARCDHFRDLAVDRNHFHLDDQFLISNFMPDEAYLYCYILRGLKHNASLFRTNLIADLRGINNKMLWQYAKVSFDDLSHNILLETIITTHLQDELDLVMTNLSDEVMLIYEIKTGAISPQAIVQVEKYLDLMDAIFPKRKICANIIGSGKEQNIKLRPDFRNRIRIVKYEQNETAGFSIRFSDITDL